MVFSLSARLVLGLVLSSLHVQSLIVLYYALYSAHIVFNLSSSLVLGLVFSSPRLSSLIYSGSSYPLPLPYGLPFLLHVFPWWIASPPVPLIILQYLSTIGCFPALLPLAQGLFVLYCISPFGCLFPWTASQPLTSSPLLPSPMDSLSHRLPLLRDCLSPWTAPPHGLPPLLKDCFSPWTYSPRGLPLPADCLSPCSASSPLSLRRRFSRIISRGHALGPGMRLLFV